MAFVYIIFSHSANKFYIRHTESTIEERVKKHNSNHKGFTGKFNDWKIVYQEQFGQAKKRRENSLF
ncbi:GIY-YIG nuclease family protein [Echinicola marina]|uniref:GIY-YIG nuclease family protein n=1 Tax=Echinicola marina TaxID=2859768 RepID=UPI001CF63F9A|nr:GIY-YIG nuclease family protein [Echinicola marina]